MKPLNDTLAAMGCQPATPGGPDGEGPVKIGGEDPDAAATIAQLTAATTAAVTATKIGEALITSLRAEAGRESSAGTAHFATTSPREVTVSVLTTTGYYRVINPDGTLGPQKLANSSFTLTISGVSGVRAFGIMSVENNGSVRSGDIIELTILTARLVAASLTGLTSLAWLDLSLNQLTTPPVLTGLTSLADLSLNNNQLTTPPVVAGLTNLSFLNLNSNQLTTPPVVTGLTNLVSLNLSHNQLTTVDSVFIQLAVAALNNQGEVFISGGTNAAPTITSAQEREDLVGAGWTIVTN